MKYLLLAFVSLLLISLLGLGGCSPSTSHAPRNAASPSPMDTPNPTSTGKEIPETFALSILHPQDEAVVDTNTITIEGQAWATAVVSINGELAETDDNGNFDLLVMLQEGPNVFDVVARDAESNEQVSQLVISYSPSPTLSPSVPPLDLNILEPVDGSAVETATVTIKGRTHPEAVVSVNGELVEVDAEGNFASRATLDEGPNFFTVIATNAEGDEATVEFVVSYVP